MTDQQFIECVAERDIDLLLLEEIHVSPAFRSWLMEQLIGPSSQWTEFVGAWHSISRATLGESDLVAIFGNGLGLKLSILIENKVGADPQPTQAVRYRLRGQAGIEEGSWNEFLTCMTAPRAYLQKTSDAAGYDRQLSYESISEWFQQGNPIDPRASYRSKILRIAVEQSRRGYQSIPNVQMTNFWREYWTLARTEFPHFKMKYPDGVPGGSGRTVISNPELGLGRIIYHKLKKGIVDLQIASAGEAVEELRSRYEPLWQDGLHVVKTQQSASVRLIVPVVDSLGEFNPQIEAIRAGLNAVARLLKLNHQIQWSSSLKPNPYATENDVKQPESEGD